MERHVLYFEKQALLMIYMLSRRCLEKTSKVSLINRSRYKSSGRLCVESIPSVDVLPVGGVRLRRPSSTSGSATPCKTLVYIFLKRKELSRNGPVSYRFTKRIVTYLWLPLDCTCDKPKLPPKLWPKWHPLPESLSTRPKLRRGRCRW
jgi:hypothetical protein